MMLISSLKSKTKKLGIRHLPSAPVLYIPMQGYKGTMELIVKEGEQVQKYQTLATFKGDLGTVIHAPVSGEVQGIITIDGKPYIVLKNDFEEKKSLQEYVLPDTLSKDKIIEIIHTFGIIGSGGAQFPTQTKYKGIDQKLSYFIVNGVECEPYLSADYTLLNEKAAYILKLLALLQKLFHIEKLVFGIEKQHKELKQVLLKVASDLQLSIEVKVMENTYPQGGELQLIKAVTGKELPKGSIPARHGILVNNVGTLWALYNALYENIPYTRRIITISGEKGKELGNYTVDIGTPIHHIINTLGINDDSENITTIIGGPMMGKAVTDNRLPVNKGSGGVLFMENPKNNRYNCIQCGYCSDVCPQHLMPMEFARYETQDDASKLRDYNLNDCIECGACAYICPSDVPLMKSIFSGKKRLREL